MADLSKWDLTRQLLNLILGPAQLVVTVLAFSLGTSFEDATRKRQQVPDPPLIPADYAFIIWSVIYGGTILYAIYQALPSQRENPLFRRIGFDSALVFFGTCAWLMCARLGPRYIWATVFFILWMFVGLFRLTGSIWKASLRGREYWTVEVPFSIFIGWVSAAVLANSSAAIGISEWPTILISGNAWCVLGLIAAGCMGAVNILRSHGNIFNVLSVLWALIAIAVRDLTVLNNRVVAFASLTVGAFLIGWLGFVRLSTVRAVRLSRVEAR